MPRPVAFVPAAVPFSETFWSFDRTQFSAFSGTKAAVGRCFFFFFVPFGLFGYFVWFVFLFL